MAKEKTTLHELCRQVAAGNQLAQADFDRDVAPLIAIIARCWLARSNDQAAFCRDAGLDPAAFFGADAPLNLLNEAELTRRICRSLIEKTRAGERRAVAETLEMRSPWQTELRPAP